MKKTFAFLLAAVCLLAGCVTQPAEDTRLPTEQTTVPTTQATTQATAEATTQATTEATTVPTTQETTQATEETAKPTKPTAKPTEPKPTEPKPTTKPTAPKPTEETGPEGVETPEEPVGPDTPDTPAEPPKETVYSITYRELNGATHSNPATYTEKTAGTITLKAPSAREGYTFLGWYIGGQKVTSLAGRSGDLTVTAKWEKSGAIEMPDVPFNP